MESDALATPSESLVHRADVSARRTDPVFNHAADGRSATLAPAYLSSDNSAPRAVATMNGRALNGAAGHSIGHSNGLSNGHAWMSIATSTSGPMAAAAAYDHTLTHLGHRTLHRQQGAYLRFGKRALDIIGAIAALVLGAPLLLLSALMIKLESRGPVFYKSTRIGRGGRPFTFLKLRSMVADAERTREHIEHLNEADGPVFKISNDPRVTRVGRFMRSTSIDEIPQFLNVLAGDMSLVGPRPPIPVEVAQYEPLQMRRLDVRPGLTCLWQISGRSRIGFQEWMRLDLEYIKHQSFALDVKILLRTIPAVLSREGAY